MPTERIPENILVDAIDATVADYLKRHGRQPVNVSHWDPSREFSEKLKAQLPIDSLRDPVLYQYSYMIGERPSIAAKLGFNKGSVAGLVTENGSMSILAAANWLAARGIREVRLMTPAYFITGYSLRRFGLKVNELPLRREGGHYLWPNNIGLGAHEALWITNPVYNTGSYSLADHAGQLATMIDAGAVAVVDEALAITPTSFAKKCGGKRDFVGIYTPHKVICLNSFKFSILIFHPEFDDFFDDWADVFFGGLSGSAIAATRHFLSDEYEAYREGFFSLIDEVRNWHDTLLHSYRGRIETDDDVRGHFLSVYFPNIDGSFGESIPFIKETIEATGTAFIPGQRSGFGREVGFCFRVNLAQDPPLPRRCWSSLSSSS